MKVFVHGLITDNRRLAAGNYFCTVIRAPEIVSAAVPGQFVMVQSFDADQFSPLLPRPFSICDVMGDELLLFYKIWGSGSYWLSVQPVGKPIGLYGPLGRGFDLTPGVPRILAGGGTGIAPLVFLSSFLNQSKKETYMTVIVAGRSAPDLAFVDHFEKVANKVLLVTEDGSAGEQGYPTPIVERLLASQKPMPRLAICGPMPMVRALWEAGCAFGAEMEAAIDAPMACGVGACLGCIDSYFGIKTCCEGPVWRNFSTSPTSNYSRESLTATPKF